MRQGSDIPEAQLIALYKAVNWTAYTNDENRGSLKTAVQNSTYVVSAWSDETLVGLARILSDDISICYLQDILIRPDSQRMGIGRILLTNCLERFAHVRTTILLTDNDQKQLKFYESLGFKNIRHLKEIEPS